MRAQCRDIVDTEGKPNRRAVRSHFIMKSDFDQTADSRVQREAQRAIEEISQHDIDTARQALSRVEQSNRRIIDRYVRSKILSGLLLAAAALVVVFCSRH